MARPKPWLPRLPLIIEALEDNTEDWVWYTRKDIERLFQIGRTAAWDLMAVVGISRDGGNGLEAAVTSEALLHYLRTSNDSHAALVELARRKKLAVTLHQASEENRSRTVRLPATSTDEWTRFQDLPNVSLAPGMLTVVFKDPLDLFAQLYRFAKAAGNEWDAFEKMLAPAAGDTPAAEVPGSAGEASADAHPS